jgi:hypothetical protein
MSLAVTVSPEAPSPQPSRRTRSSKAPKPTSRPEEVKPRKVSVYLSLGALKRLDVHIAMEGGDRSRLIEQLIQDGLRRYEMPRRRSEATLPVSEIGSEATA